MVCVAIVGTGDHAHGLAHLFFVNNAENNRLLVTKPGLASGGTLHDTNVPLVCLKDALQQADVVVFAIPARVLIKFMEEYLDLLKDKILVDTTNSSVRGEDLLSILALTQIQSVKAFNDIGAVEVLLDKPPNKRKILSQMCSKYPAALKVVREFAQASLGLDVKVVPYHQFDKLAQSQTKLDEPWVAAIVLMVILFVVTLVYSILRYNVYKDYDWFHLPLQVTNKAICWSALNGFALSQLPGVLARILNALSDDSLRTKPVWLQRFLQLRKHLGLVSLWFLMVHILMSMILFSPAYYGKFYMDQTATVTTKLNSTGENSLLFGVLGAALYAIMGICSLPSVGSQMTNVQWGLVYGPVAWMALSFGTIHVLIMGVKSWTTPEEWPGGMPPITMMATLLPMLLMGLKLVQMMLVLFDSSVLSSKSRGPVDTRTLIRVPVSNNNRSFKNHSTVDMFDESTGSSVTDNNPHRKAQPPVDNPIVATADDDDDSTDSHDIGRLNV